jgi:hypothetical protein
VKNKEQAISFLGVLILAIILPGILKAANSAVRYMAGAEGRLAALNVEVNRTEENQNDENSDAKPEIQLMSSLASRQYREMVERPEAERLRITGEGTWVKAIAVKLQNKYQLLAVNYDEKGTHTELVPVSFINLSGPRGEYVLKTIFIPGAEISEKIATSAAVIQKYIPMSPNSVVFMELTLP